MLQGTSRLCTPPHAQFALSLAVRQPVKSYSRRVAAPLLSDGSMLRCKSTGARKHQRRRHSGRPSPYFKLVGRLFLPTRLAPSSCSGAQATADDASPPPPPSSPTTGFNSLKHASSETITNDMSLCAVCASLFWGTEHLHFTDNSPKTASRSRDRWKQLLISFFLLMKKRTRHRSRL
ncbi:hypothetical protein TGRUB_242310 [Toxoplasma gondii RUB]|uniref:Uncharacterized protein n=1 Tax=Toxoplasma gondii RUB TaxID=935652 RepID=A0A086LU12_TOXGO|nr:hypothetical protein TGRUB_242310 [Toxoplasma gondii RUB]